MPNAPAAPRGLLLGLSGPSGSGKSSLVQGLLADRSFPIEMSVSVTSRAPRPQEVEGVHYRFVDQEHFESARTRGEFLESANVHGNWYGTPRLPVEAALAASRWVLLEIDVKGFRQIKAAMPEAQSFFLRAPSLENYEERLRARGTESEEAIRRRIDDARDQLKHAAEYDFQIVNETLEQALRTFRTLLRGLAGG